MKNGLKSGFMVVAQSSWVGRMGKILSFFAYAPTQLVAPSAVTMAVATDAMICTINFSVSFLLMVLVFLVLPTDYCPSEREHVC